MLAPPWKSLPLETLCCFEAQTPRHADSRSNPEHSVNVQAEEIYSGRPKSCGNCNKAFCEECRLRILAPLPGFSVFIEDSPCGRKVTRLKF